MVSILIFMSLALFAMPAAVSGDDDSMRPPTRQRLAELGAMTVRTSQYNPAAEVPEHAA